MAIDQLIQRLITQETHNVGEEKHDLDILLNHISDLRESSKTLVEQLQQEQQRCERQTQFVVNLSRRLQESISILLGAAWMLDVHGDHIKSATRRKHYSTIREAILELNRQLSLVQSWPEQVFDLTPMLHELEKFGLSSLENQKYHLMHSENKSACQTISRKRAPFESCVLKMILDELLDNALKFSSGTKPVECQIHRSDRQVQISVRDYGPGIPEQEKLNVFKSFYRGLNSGGVEGHGLGLSIVKKLVSDYRGTILLKSKLGKGTEIMISIPLNETEMRSPASAA